MVHEKIDKTKIILKVNAIVFYPIQLMLLNFLKGFRQYIVNHSFALPGHLLVFTSDSSNSQQEVYP